MTETNLLLGETITVDGGAGAGKSSLGIAFAIRNKLSFLDSGMLYRTATYIALKQNLLKDKEFQLEKVRILCDLIANVDVQTKILQRNHKLEQQLIVEGEDITDFLQSQEIERIVPLVATQQGVRDAVNDQVRRIAAVRRSVIAGRDIGRVVIPEAKLKFFIIADPEKTAMRRAKQYGLDFDIVKRDLIARNERDKVNTIPAEDAFIVDNSGDFEDALVKMQREYEK